jgi:hypothetical protein
MTLAHCRRIKGTLAPYAAHHPTTSPAQLHSATAAPCTTSTIFIQHSFTHPQLLAYSSSHTAPPSTASHTASRTHSFTHPQLHPPTASPTHNFTHSITHSTTPTAQHTQLNTHTAQHPQHIPTAHHTQLHPQHHPAQLHTQPDPHLHPHLHPQLNTHSFTPMTPSACHTASGNKKTTTSLATLVFVLKCA